MNSRIANNLQLSGNRSSSSEYHYHYIIYNSNYYNYDIGNRSAVPIGFFMLVITHQNQHKYSFLALLSSRLTEVREENGSYSVRSSALDVHTCSPGPTAHLIHSSARAPVYMMGG